MTVICPSCDARFRDPPAEIIATSRLQCSKCDHEWAAHEQKPRLKLDAPTLAPTMEDLREGPDVIKTALPVVMPKADDTPSTQPIYVDRASDDTPTKPFSLALPTAALMLLLMLAGGIGLRHGIMDQIPATKAFYQAAGLVPAVPELEIANITTTRSDRDGIRQLIVKGEIQNIADSTVPVPPLKLTMRGKVDANLFAWTVTAKKNSLKAGEKSKFTAIAHDFPTETVKVEVEFDLPKAESD